MEVEQTEMDSRPENLAVSEYANVDEAIPIDLKKGQITEAYKETKKKDINNIETFVSQRVGSYSLAYIVDQKLHLY